MGCFGGSNGCFGSQWLIILVVIFFLIFCNNGSDISDIFNDCGLVWIAIILLLLFLCNNDNCEDDC